MKKDRTAAHGAGAVEGVRVLSKAESPKGLQVEAAGKLSSTENSEKKLQAQPKGSRQSGKRPGGSEKLRTSRILVNSHANAPRTCHWAKPVQLRAVVWVSGTFCHSAWVHLFFTTVGPRTKKRGPGGEGGSGKWPGILPTKRSRMSTTGSLASLGMRSHLSDKLRRPPSCVPRRANIFTFDAPEGEQGCSCLLLRRTISPGHSFEGGLAGNPDREKVQFLICDFKPVGMTRTPLPIPSAWLKKKRRGQKPLELGTCAFARGHDCLSLLAV